MRGDSDESGWASRSLDDSLQQAEASGLTVWQIVMLGAALTSDVSGSIWVPVIAHLTVFGIGWLTVSRRLRAWPLLIATYAAMILDYRAVIDVNSALSFATLWTSLLTTAVPVLILPRRYAGAFSLLAVGATTFALLFWHGDWGVRPPISMTVTAAVLVLAILPLITRVRTFANETDGQEILVARERQDLMVKRTVARSTAEDARVVHDTLINTLGAIASGGSALGDTALVRERSARDVEAVEALLEGHLEDLEGFQLAIPRDMELRRTGLDGEELEWYAAQVPERAARAVRGAVQELIRNAVKHSGAHRVDVDIRQEGSALIVTVSDEGAGFDGRLIAGRGLAESVVARARDADVDVTIGTGHGTGTTVTLTVAFGGARAARIESADSSPDSNSIVEQIRRTAGWTWAIVMVGFGAASVAVNGSGSALSAYAMLIVVGGLSLAAWGLCRRGASLPRWLTVLILLGIPVAFLMGLGGIDFGRGNADGWSTIAMTPLLVVLLVTTRSRTPFFIGIGLLALTAAATTYFVGSAAANGAAIIPLDAATQLAVLAAWLVLHHVIDDIGAKHMRIQRTLAEDRMERAARDTVATARARWTASGVRTSLEVVRQIARGEVDPGEHRVRAQCAEAERYLRQVLLLSPELVHLGPWIVRALADARSRSVSLNVRGFAEDVSDEMLAESLGRLILAGVDVLPPGAELDVGLFPRGEGTRLLMVGPGGSLGALTTPAVPSGPSTFTYRQLGTQDLVEFTMSADG